VYFLAGPRPGLRLWAVAASGGEPLAIGDVPRFTQTASVFPDGKTFAFATSEGMLIGAPGSGKPLERAPGFSRAPTEFVRISPDGRKIAVRAPQEHGSLRDPALWIVPYPSGTARVVDSIAAGHVSWFPDSRHLLVCLPHGNQNSSLSIVDTENGSTQTILRSATFILNASVSPDGRRIAYSTGQANGNLVEVSIDTGHSSVLLTRSGMSNDPDWAPSGSHFLFASISNGPAEIEDRTVGDGFVRRLAAAGIDGVPKDADSMIFPQWAPDGHQFLFNARANGFWQLWIANASAGKPRMLDPASVQSYGGAWSPDGEWIAYYRLDGKRSVLAKVRAGVGATPEVLEDGTRTAIAIRASGDYPAKWSADGKWILYAAPEGLAIVSSDGQTRRVLYEGGLFPSYGFSKDGRAAYLVIRDPSSLAWQLLWIDIQSGARRTLVAIDFPSTTEQTSGFSLHPDGRRFAISVISRPRDIWMLEGFPEPASSTWWSGRLFRR
jgi:Tol biopolymer transport system component